MIFVRMWTYNHLKKEKKTIFLGPHLQWAQGPYKNHLQINVITVANWSDRFSVDKKEEKENNPWIRC